MLKLSALDHLIRNPLLSTHQLRAMLALRPIVAGNIQMHWDGVQWWERDLNNVLLRRVEVREFHRRLANDLSDDDEPFDFGALYNDRRRIRNAERQQRREMQEQARPPTPPPPQIQQQQQRAVHPDLHLDNNIIIVDSDSDDENNELERRILKRAEDKAEREAWLELEKRALQPFAPGVSNGTAIFECAICLDDVMVRRPIVLNCGHYFCLSCIYQLCKMKRGENKQQCCPSCRVSIKYSKFPNETFPSMRDD